MYFLMVLPLLMWLRNNWHEIHNLLTQGEEDEFD